MNQHKKSVVLLTLASLGVLGLMVGLVNPSYAQSNELSVRGNVEMTGGIPTNPIDPEHPDIAVDPGPSPSTKGPLRIDFVSSLNFGQNKINQTKRNFFANAQMFHDGTPPRGNYIQVTDERSEKQGWTLQVRQEYQFRNTIIQENAAQELKGAMLSFDHGWANSVYTWETPPIITKDTIEISELATTQNIAVAEAGSGKGQWIIEFGASATNEKEQKNTLFLKKGQNGETILDPAFENQPIFENQAILLSVPAQTTINPVQYETELTWILASLPN